MSKRESHTANGKNEGKNQRAEKGQQEGKSFSQPKRGREKRRERLEG